MKIKVGFFVSSINAGGIENYLLRFLTFYKDTIEATVYCKSGRLGELEAEYRNIGVKLIPFKIGYFNPVHLLKLFKEVKANQYDAVVDFTGNFAAFPLAISWIVNIKRRIVWYRNSDDKFVKSLSKNLYNNIVNRITKKYSTNILSNSRSALDYFYKYYNWRTDDSFEVIYNGIDAKSFLSTNKDLRSEFNIPVSSFVVGNIGRYNDQKNHKTAIKVAISLCKMHNDIYFIFCGKDVDIAYKKLIEKEKLTEKIILTGVRRDIIKVLNTLDCFYFPSIIEGQPNALIEAMVVGVPFVSSNIDPVKETVPLDLHQYLIPPLDVELAIKTILRIKEDSQFRNTFKVSDWAIKRFDSFVQFNKFFVKINK